MQGPARNESLRHLSIICRHNVRRVLLDRGTALWLLALPLALIGILGMGLQGLMSAEFTPASPFRVAVAETPSGAHQVLMEPLQGLPQYVEVVAADTAEDARAMVTRRDVDAALTVSLTPASSPTVTIIGPPGSVVTEMLREIVESVLRQAEGGGAGSTPANPTSPVDAARSVGDGVADRAAGRVAVNQAPTPADSGQGAPDNPVTDGRSQAAGLPDWLQTDAFTYYAVGIMAMFVMFAAHAVSSAAVRDRATDAYDRLRALGVKPAVYMVGGSLASIIVSFLFLSAMAVISSLLFGVQWGNVLSWAVLTLTGATAAAGLSLVVMALIPKAEHVDGAGAAVFNLLAFLGGSMTPLHVLPEWFHTSLGWLPNRAVLTGYLKASEGAGLAAVAGELQTLGVATVLLFALGWAVWTLRTKEEAR